MSLIDRLALVNPEDVAAYRAGINVTPAILVNSANAAAFYRS